MIEHSEYLSTLELLLAKRGTLSLHALQNLNQGRQPLVQLLPRPNKSLLTHCVDYCFLVNWVIQSCQLSCLLLWWLVEDGRTLMKMKVFDFGLCLFVHRLKSARLRWLPRGQILLRLAFFMLDELEIGFDCLHFHLFAILGLRRHGEHFARLSLRIPNSIWPHDVVPGFNFGKSWHGLDRVHLA